MSSCYLRALHPDAGCRDSCGPTECCHRLHVVFYQPFDPEKTPQWSIYYEALTEKPTFVRCIYWNVTRVLVQIFQKIVYSIFVT